MYTLRALRTNSVTISSHSSKEEAAAALKAAIPAWSGSPTLLFIHSETHGASNHTTTDGGPIERWW